MTGTDSDEVTAQRSNAFKDLNVFRNQVAPRARQIVGSWPVLVAVAGALLTTLGIVALPVRHTPIAEIAAMGFTYASISLAACVSGLVLSLALPGDNRLRKWSNMTGSVEAKSVLSDLLFTFFWAACAQLAVLLVCFGAVLFGGTLRIGEPAPLPVSHVAALIFSFTVVVYSLAQLFVVLQTLVQVGVLVIMEEQAASAEHKVGTK